MIRKIPNYKASGREILAWLELNGQVVSQSGNLGERSEFDRVVVDSRRVSSGDIFLAYRGVSADGHEHIESAIARGAGFLVIERADSIPAGSAVPWIKVPDGRAAWSYLSSLFSGHPEKKLRFYGITGTNGKTSTVWMLKELLSAHQVPVLSIGTLGSFLGTTPVKSSHTTPDPDQLFSLFRLALDSGIDTVVMEVSSHSLRQSKLAPLRFEGAAFTSFSRDHLDFHSGMEDYFSAKLDLFRHYLAPNACCAISDSIPRVADISALTGPGALYGSSAVRPAGSEIRIVGSKIEGTDLEICRAGSTIRGTIPYFGRFAIENFVCAALLAEKRLGRFPDPATWPNLSQVPGRLQKLSGSPSAPAVFVDYAHTPDALQQVLKALRPGLKGRMVLVFGCGGNRDPGKRPLMGEIGEQLADKSIITSDNPRDEDPKLIADQILAGYSDKSKATVEIDRNQAIGLALTGLGPADCVVLAGKGHESYQIISGRSYEFDDCVVARRWLTQLYPE